MSSEEDDRRRNLRDLLSFGFEDAEITCTPGDLLEVCHFMSHNLEDNEIVAWCIRTSSRLSGTPIECLADGLRPEVAIAAYLYIESGRTVRDRVLAEQAALEAEAASEASQNNAERRAAGDAIVLPFSRPYGPRRPRQSRPRRPRPR